MMPEMWERLMVDREKRDDEWDGRASRTIRERDAGADDLNTIYIRIATFSFTQSSRVA
jgi:hypothetical protein